MRLLEDEQRIPTVKNVALAGGPGSALQTRPSKPPGPPARATFFTVGMRCGASVDTHSVSLPKPPWPPARATFFTVGMRCCASVDTHSVSLPKPPGPPARATSPMVGMRCCASVDTHSVSLPKPPGPPARATSPMVGMRCGASVDTHSVSLPKPPGPPARDTLFPSQFRLELKSFISGQLAHSAVLGGGVVAIDAVFFEHSHADEIVGGSH